jgi:hypothetical protein
MDRKTFEALKEVVALAEKQLSASERYSPTYGEAISRVYGWMSEVDKEIDD